MKRSMLSLHKPAARSLLAAAVFALAGSAAAETFKLRIGAGHPVTGIDRNPEVVQAAATLGEAIAADLENAPWPLPGRLFGAVVVTNYLWRPLLPTLVQSLAPGGVLLYETFASGNETVGRPARADFLLQPGELLTACASLQVVAYEDGFLDRPARFVQRIAARRERADDLPRHAI